MSPLNVRTLRTSEYKLVLMKFVGSIHNGILSLRVHDRWITAVVNM